MNIKFLCNREEIDVRVPDSSIIYESDFPKPEKSDAETTLDAINNPIGCANFLELLKNKKEGKVVSSLKTVVTAFVYYKILLLFILINRIIIV